MKFRHYEFLALFLMGCVGAVALSSRLNAMYLSKPIRAAALQESASEELPARSDSIVYGNQTPFGANSGAGPIRTGTNSFSPPVDSDFNDASVTAQPRSVLRPTYNATEPGTLGQDVADKFSYLTDENEIENRASEFPTNDGIAQPTTPRLSAPFLNIQPDIITQPRESFPSPLINVAPGISSQAVELPMMPPAILGGSALDGSNIPVNEPLPPGSLTNPGLLHGPGCDCGALTCVRCCQPRCISKTIFVPEWYTVWSSIYETRYKTQIREQAYTVEEEVEHQVPVVTQFTVMVPEPRLRTFQTYRREEYQVPVQEPYTVMVPKPKQRQETVEREEAYKVPVEEQYTVMVPQEKEISETKYKIVKEKEPYEKKYTVEVPKVKKRVVMEYKTEVRSEPYKEPYPVKVREERVRPVTKYRLEKKTREVTEMVIEYVKITKKRSVPKVRVVTRYKDVPENYVDYVDIEYEMDEENTVQVPIPRTEETTYKVSVPFIQKKFERYFVNESYEEDVTLSYESREQVPRGISRPYFVKIPYIDHVTRQYKVRIPYEKMEKGFRTIPKQIPETKYQLARRDVGRWVTETCVVPTFEITNDDCGCSTCCPRNRTVRKTVWKPRIVTERIPYTTFKTVKQKIPYEYPVMAEREEIQTRKVPVTKYRREQREAELTVYDSKPVTKTNSFTVRKFRRVAKTREIEVQKFREEERVKKFEFTDYQTRSEPKKVPYTVQQPEPKQRTIKLPYTAKETYYEDEYYEYTEPVEKLVTRTEEYTVKKAYFDEEKYYVDVPVIKYRNKTKEIKIQMPNPRFETYTVMVPEIRTKIEYREVERRVPYTETKMVKVMVPEIRTRRVYKTKTRVVSEIKTQTYMTTVPEVKQRTVYKTKYNDVPVNQSEIYWENVPKVLKKTEFKTVKKKVNRPRMRRVPVKVPYQVQIRIPHRACRMVPRTITVPVEECCERCTYRIMDLDTIAPLYIDYGARQLNQVWNWVLNPMKMY